METIDYSHQYNVNSKNAFTDQTRTELQTLYMLTLKVAGRIYFSLAVVLKHITNKQNF